MEIDIAKCSHPEHKDVAAVKVCMECKKYFCKKCEQFHSSFYTEHHSFLLDKNLKDIFTGFCKEQNHYKELNYFCKDHNVLCCSSCISKIESRGNGQHSLCNVCDINDISGEKKKNLSNNIKNLEVLSKQIQTLHDELKKIFEGIGANKENVKSEIQKIFTKIRAELDLREEMLLKEVEDIFDKEFQNKEVENFLNEKKFPDKIKMFIDKGKIAEKDWDKNENKNSLIYDCINVENTIKKINDMNANLEKTKKENKKLNFYIQSDEAVSTIKNLGSFNDFKRINQQDVSININNFNPDNLTCQKEITSNFYNYDNNCFDCLCFFISKNKEYILGYSDSNNYYYISFYDINANTIVKQLNHGNYIYTIKYYYNKHDQYDMILSTGYINNIKIWNFNEGTNILTISDIIPYNQYSYYYLYSSCIIFEPNDFTIFCVGWGYNCNGEYIKVYNSKREKKNLGNNNVYRYFVDSSEVNEKTFLIAGGHQGVEVFNFPKLDEYNTFIENNDGNYHLYAKIVKNNNNYNLIDVGNFYDIKIWDFINKNLICKINYDNPKSYLKGFVLINNRYLISGSNDNNNIKVIDIDKKVFIKNINKHTSNVTGIKKIKDKNGNDFIVSYGQDNKIYLWSFKKEQKMEFN